MPLKDSTYGSSSPPAVQLRISPDSVHHLLVHSARVAGDAVCAGPSWSTMHSTLVGKIGNVSMQVQAGRTKTCECQAPSTGSMS